MNTPITIIIPTLNEQAYLKSCLDSLRQQDYPNIAEILVVDGGSIDGTREIAQAESGNIRLIDNPRVTAAAAMNIGIISTTSEVFVRVDAHTLYARDYVSRSVKTFIDYSAQVVGGLMRPVGTTSFGNAVATVTSSPLGVGPGRFHYSEKLQEVETVYLGIFDRNFVLKVGGYDEENLQWGAEDQELNFRIRKAGGKILLDPRIRSSYFPRDNPRALARQYHNYGMCKASTLAKHKTLPYWRPMVPAMMVLSCMVWVLTTFWLNALFLTPIPFAFYVIFAIGAALLLTRDKKSTVPQTALALSICHWAYGFGFWRGILRIASLRKFDSKPKNSRR